MDLELSMQAGSGMKQAYCDEVELETNSSFKKAICSGTQSVWPCTVSARIMVVLTVKQGMPAAPHKSSNALV